MPKNFRPFDPKAEFHQKQRNLPHRAQKGCTYFVTWRTTDAVPVPIMQQWLAERDAWLELNPKPWDGIKAAAYRRLFSRRIERWLDQGHGACELAAADAREIVTDALHHFDGKRYDLDAFVVMPNHVHVIVMPHDDHPLSVILQSWKGFTARELNLLLSRQGAFWMDESFDHAIRSEAHLERFRRYVRENPVKAGLSAGTFGVWERDSPREKNRLESLCHNMAADLAEIGRMHMPFGKFGPEKFPPKGVPLYDLPAEYLAWFAGKGGFPKGRLGELMRMVYQMKVDGSDFAFDVFRKARGGKVSLREPRVREYTVEN